MTSPKADSVEFQLVDLVAKSLVWTNAELRAGLHSRAPDEAFLALFRAELLSKRGGVPLSQPVYKELDNWYERLVELLSFWDDIAPG